jgi:SAM-dependent methyltransferase
MIGSGAGAFGIWTAGIEVGLRTLPREPVLGLKRVAYPVGYWRSVEFAYVWRQLQIPRRSRVLDVGSPKDLAAMLARHRGFDVTATDILPEAVDLCERYTRVQGLAGNGPGRVRSEVQDGRALSYETASFDAAYSVSVLEHIPDDGDSVAMRELLRVVRPGGLVVATVPFDRTYRETFVNGRVYERTAAGNAPIFYERHYDRDALTKRLLRAGPAEVVDVSFWGEGTVRAEAVLRRVGAWLSPVEGLLSTVFLRPVQPEGPAHPMAAFIALKRRA